ncbi:hypothetical protein QDY72_03670, partial [Kingella negevensis]|nr:hypothetical protein [Kingella negevensis]
YMQSRDWKRGDERTSALREPMALFLNLRELSVSDFKGNEWDNFPNPPESGIDNTQDLSAYAREKGFDGTRFDNVIDTATGKNDGRTKPATVFTVFAPTNIKSAINNNGQFDFTNVDIRFSRGNQDNQDVITQASRTLKRLAEHIENGSRYIPNAPIDLGNTPAVFTALGAPQLPLRIVEPKKLFQIVGNRNANDHEISSDILAQVPDKLHEPLAVFNSKTDGLIALLELRDSKNNPVLTAIHLNKKNGYNQVNKVVSIYGKDNARAVFSAWQKKGLLRYVNNRKSPEVLTSFGVQFPTEKSNQGLKQNVLSPDDVVNHISELSREQVGKIQAALTDSLGEYADRVRVASAMESAPEHSSKLISDRVEGWYDPKTDSVVLVAENLSPERAVWVAWHELGHRGVSVTGFEDYRAAMREAFDNPTVRRLANAIRQKRSGKDLEIADLAARDPAVATEEALVELFAAQQTGNYDGIRDYYGVSVPVIMQKNIRGLLQRVGQRLRAIFAKLLGKPVESFSDADVFDLLNVVRGNFDGSLNVEKGNHFLEDFSLSSENSKLLSELRTSLSGKDYLSEKNIKTEADLSQYQGTQFNQNSGSLNENIPESSFDKTEKELGGEVAYKQAKADGKTELDYRQWVQVRTPEFKAWFGDWENNPESASKVVNPKTGEPLMVYHGTKNDFTAFSKEKIGSATDKGLRGRGFYLSQNKRTSEGYGNNVMGLFANVKTPFIPSQFNSAQEVADYLNARLGLDEFDAIEAREFGFAPRFKVIGDYASRFTSYLKDLGFDGVLYLEAQEIVAFNPNQIKSATDNTGAFDSNNDDIRFSRADNSHSKLPAALKAKQSQTKAAVSSAAKKMGKGFQAWTKTLPAKEQPLFNEMGELSAGLAAYHGLENALKPLFAKVKMANGYADSFNTYMRDFRASLNMAGQTAYDLGDKGKAFSEAERKLLSDVLEKELPEGVDVSPELAAAAEQIRAVLSQQSDDLVALGMLPKDSAERFCETYLPRLYNRKMDLFDNTNLAKMNRQFQRALRGDLGKAINGQHLKGRGIFETVYKTEQARYEKMGFELREDFGNKGKNAGKVLMWRDYTREERQQMGEVRDAYLRFTSGYVKTQADIAKGMLFKRVAEDDKLSSKTAVDGWVQLSQTPIAGTGGVLRYGALAGMWVHPDVAYQLQQQFYIDSALQKIWRSMLGWWKTAKTVYNPVAHVNNVMSNIAMMTATGGLKHLPAAARAIRNKDTLYREALQVGLVGEAVDAGGVLEMFIGLNGTDGEVMDGYVTNLLQWADKKTGSVVSKIGGKMQDAYRLEDEVFRLALFKDARERGLSVNEARDYATTFLFDYSEVPQGVKVLRDTGLLPFVSYTYKAVPAMLRLALTKPHRMLALTAMIYGINALSYAMLGDGGDEGKEREYMPEYQQGYTSFGTPKLIRMPWNDDGKPVFLDIYRFLPLGDFADTGNRMGGLNLPNWLVPNGPAINHMAALMFNKDMFSGEELVKDYMSDSEKTAIRAKWVAAQWLPASVGVPFSYHTNNVLDGLKNQFEGTALSDALEKMGYTGKTYRGEDKDLNRALLGAVGVKLRGDSADKLQGSYERKVGYEIREIKSDMAHIRKDNSLSVPAKAAKLKERQARIAELTKQMIEHRKNIQAA